METRVPKNSARRRLDHKKRAESLAALTPEQRELYEAIRSWRLEHGSVDFDIVEELGRLRGRRAADNRSDGEAHGTSDPEAESTLTTASLQELLRPAAHRKRLATMPPERRALYDRIMARRRRVGDVGFDVVEAIREIREGD